MGTLSETLAVYGLQGALWAAALWRVGARPCVAVMLPALALSWWAGEVFTGNDRDAANLLIQLGVILIMCEMPVGRHEKVVALISLALIPWHAAGNVTVPYMGHYTYAVVINCAVTAQLLIAGGMVDDWGRRLDHWAGRLHPRLARSSRHVGAP